MFAKWTWYLILEISCYENVYYMSGCVGCLLSFHEKYIQYPCCACLNRYESESFCWHFSWYGCLNLVCLSITSSYASFLYSSCCEKRRRVETGNKCRGRKAFTSPRSIYRSHNIRCVMGPFTRDCSQTLIICVFRECLSLSPSAVHRSPFVFHRSKSSLALRQRCFESFQCGV